MKYFLKKDGYYYRKHSAGYTDSIANAGIFNEDYALSHTQQCEGVSAIPINKISDENIRQIKDYVNGSMEILEALANSKVSLRKPREDIIKIPADSGIEELDSILERYNNGEFGLLKLICTVWNTAIAEGTKVK